MHVVLLARVGRLLKPGDKGMLGSLLILSRIRNVFWFFLGPAPLPVLVWRALVEVLEGCEGAFWGKSCSAICVLDTIRGILGRHNGRRFNADRVKK